VAVLVTGDEVFDPCETPSRGRIRDCNGPVLVALLRRAGVEGKLLGIVKDEAKDLVSAIETGLGFDLLMLSGGVSMGVYDLVGEVMRSMGVEVLFDRVAIKPGRPFTFGTRGGTLVFGCPGNPVSTYVIFQVFALPALRRMMGSEGGPRDRVRGVLESAVSRQPGRDGYRQARARWTGGGYSVQVIPTSGSADFVSCARGNALAIIPADRAAMEQGEEIDLILLDDFAER
jgi:molybdopterin molybdotransferase